MPLLLPTLGALLLVLHVGVAIAQQTWIVDQQGGSGFTKIQPAVNAAAPGDTILIYPGRYLEYAPYDFGALTEDTYVVIDKNDITIRGTSRDDVIIGPGTYDWPSAFAPNGIATTLGTRGCRIENLTIENIPEGAEFQESVQMNNCRFAGCRVGVASYSASSFEWYALTVEGSLRFGVAVVGDASNAVIRDSQFLGHGIGILGSGTQNLSVLRCRFVSTVVKLQSSGSATVRNCTFEPGTVGAVGHSYVEVYNCHFAENPDPNVQIHSSGARVEHNVFERAVTENIAIWGSTDVVFHYNQILNRFFVPSTRSVWVHCYDGCDLAQLDFRNNWWGTTDTSLIDEWILDANDEPERDLIVNYNPILTQAPVPNRKESIGQIKGKY